MTNARKPAPAPEEVPAVANLPRVALKYLGGGSAVPGVPARDLTLAEAEALSAELYAETIASGLYGYVKAGEE